MRGLLLIAVLLAGCGNDAVVGEDAGGLDLGFDAGTADAAADAARIDAEPVDAGRADADIDAAPAVCPVCEASSPCQLATCVDGACLQAPVADGLACGDEQLCVTGACVARGCGDGFREAGEACDDGNQADGDACSATCTPTLLPIAARPGQDDWPAGPRAGAAVDGRGEVLLVWSSARSGRSYALLARRYSAAGVALGAPIVIDDQLFVGWDAEVSVAGRGEGWAVAWSSPRVDGDGAGVALVMIGAAGELGRIETANPEVTGDQRSPVLLGWPEAELTVAWMDSATLRSRVFSRRFADSGEPTGGAAAVHPGNLAEQSQPVLAAGAVAWTRRMAAEPPAIWVEPLGGAAVQVSEAHASQPSMARRADGGLVLAWTSHAADSRGDVLAREVDADGHGAPSAFPVAVSSAGETSPVLVSHGDELLILLQTAQGSSRDLRLLALAGTSSQEIASPELGARLAAGGRQQRGSLAGTAAGVWITWSDDAFVAGFAESVLAYVLPR